jgi:RelA/SpoT family protein
MGWLNMLNLKTTSNISCFNGNFYLPLEDWFLQKYKKSDIKITKQIEVQLEKFGFKRASDINEVLGKTIALTRGTFFYDFLSYDVDGFIKGSFGSEISQKEKNVKYHSIDDQYKYKYHENMELFLPNYFIEDGSVMYIDKDKNPFQYEEKEIIWGYPLKHYLQEDEILIQHPKEFNAIDKYLKSTIMPDLDLLEDTVKELLESKGLEFDITSRAKNIRGVHSKLAKNDYMTLEEVYDVNGLNIMTNNVSDCYKVLEIINEDLCPVEFYWDYISMPKTNKFQCLLVHPIERDLKIEFQIRTKLMHEVAESVTGAAFDYRVNY